MARSKGFLIGIVAIGLVGLFWLTRADGPPSPRSPAGDMTERTAPAPGMASPPAAADRALDASGAPMQGPDYDRSKVSADLEDSLKRLHSEDPFDRLTAIVSLVDLDPQVAQRELEALLRGSEQDDEVRVEAFGQLKDLSEGPKAVAVLIEGLNDRSAQVRSEAASLLQFEDIESDPRILPALREARARERDPEVVEELDATLESLDVAPTADSRSNDASTAKSASGARPGPG